MMMRIPLFVLFLSAPFSGTHGADSRESSVDEISGSLCLTRDQLISEARQDDVLAYRRLAMHFLACSESEIESLKYLELAARNGTSLDVLRYAEELERVHGSDKAFPVYLKAARRGDSVAQKWMADAQEARNGDRSEVLDWLECAARQGSWSAMARLSDLTNETQPAVSLAWLRLAAEYAPARRSRGFLARSDEYFAALNDRQRELFSSVLEELKESISRKK